jgi:dihydroflavonol-4-reductase
VLGPDFSGSSQIIKSLPDGAMPAAPKIYFGLVDVRDVAGLHLRAMTSPAANGERFIAVAGETISILDIAKVLRRRMGASAARVPRIEAPNWVARLAALGHPLAAGSNLAARQGQAYHERQGEELAWLGAAWRRRGHRVDRRKLDQARLGQTVTVGATAAHHARFYLKRRPLLFRTRRSARISP